MPLFLRIAPELYLKRLVVGGFERVFEINRNFRNEGVSARHNPEFTMIEFYQAYSTYEDVMDLTERMFNKLAMDILGTTELEYQGEAISFKAPFERLPMTKAIERYAEGFDMSKIADRDYLAEYVRTVLKQEVKDIFGIGKLQTIVFEETAEHQLRQPTFVTEYPAETSPLARRNDDNPEITDRFELFIGGREIAPMHSQGGGIDQIQGIVVNEVSPGGPAANAGIQVNDVIISVNGSPAVSALETMDQVAEIRPGSIIPVEVMRNDKKLTIQVTIQEYPATN